MSKKCNNCGAYIEETAMFCPECGAKQISGSKICTKCGESLPLGASFCSECGTPINANSSPAAPAAASRAFSIEDLIKSKQQEYAVSQRKAIKEEQKRLAEEAERKAKEQARKEEEERLNREEEEKKKAEAKAKREGKKRQKEEQERFKREEEAAQKAEEQARKKASTEKKATKEKTATVQAVKPVKSEPQHESMEFVDLGLSVKWARCNLGAKEPEEFGDYYAWGEIEKYDFKDDRHYKFQVKGSGLTKYNTKETYGKVVDNIKQLELSDDAAHQILGGGWRMPTIMEVDELIKSCSLVSTTINGVKGLRIRSKIKGYTDKWIFLPAAGYGFYESPPKISSSYDCFYWTSSLYTRRPDSALTVFCDIVYEGRMDRYCGLSIRPVIK